VFRDYIDFYVKEVIFLSKRGVPLRNGSGGGTRKNRGRGGCAPSKQPKRGKGSNRRRNS